MYQTITKVIFVFLFDDLIFDKMTDVSPLSRDLVVIEWIRCVVSNTSSLRLMEPTRQED